MRYNSGMKKKVVVGLSGGVDSAVAAYLLKQRGYEVVGLFMRNWVEEEEDGACTADEDFYDVRRVCGVLDIPYYGVDFSREYYERVFKHFLSCEMFEMTCFIFNFFANLSANCVIPQVHILFTFWLMIILVPLPFMYITSKLT